MIVTELNDWSAFADANARVDVSVIAALCKLEVLHFAGKWAK